MKIIRNSDEDSSSKVSASYGYGGAYDIDPDSFFTKEEIVEFAYDVADRLNNDVKLIFDKSSNFLLQDVYIVDYNRIVVDLYDTVSEVDVSGQAKIDMRRIRRPSDLYKYLEPIVGQMLEDYKDYTSDIMSSTSTVNIPSKVDLNNVVIDEVSEIDASSDFPSEDYSDENIKDEIEHIYIPFEYEVIINDDGSIEYPDKYAEWLDERYLESMLLDGRLIDDKVSACEKIDELISGQLPWDAGKYLVFGDADLVYYVSTWIDDYEDFSAEYSEKDSSISNFGFKKI